MRFAFIAKHRSIWPVAWLCEALDVSRSGFHAWLTRSPSNRTRYNDALLGVMRASFIASDRTYGARRVWHDVLAEGLNWTPRTTCVLSLVNERSGLFFAECYDAVGLWGDR